MNYHARQDMDRCVSLPEDRILILDMGKILINAITNNHVLGPSSTLSTGFGEENAEFCNFKAGGVCG
jgi:hypothetical protein